MRTPQLPLEYLARASKETLESFELTRLNRAANFRKEARDILKDWVQAEVESRLARFILERRREQSGDGRSHSLEFASPLELDPVSTASRSAQAVAKTNVNSFADPIGHFRESANSQSLARVHSVPPPAWAQTAQLTFREFLSGVHFQFELFGASPESHSSAPENIGHKIAKPDRPRPTQLPSLSQAAGQTRSQEYRAARPDKLRPPQRRFTPTGPMKSIWSQFVERLPTPGFSAVASTQPIARMTAAGVSPTASALPRSRSPFEATRVSSASLVQAQASAGEFPTAHRRPKMRCGPNNSSNRSSRLFCSDIASRQFIRPNLRKFSANCVHRTESTLSSRSNFDCRKFTTASSFHSSHFVSSSSSVPMPSSLLCAVFRGCGAITLFMETLEWIYPHLSKSQIAFMRFSPVFDRRFAVSTGPDAAALRNIFANHSYRVVRGGMKSQIPGSAIFCRSSRAALSSSHSLLTSPPPTSSFNAIGARITAPYNFTTKSFCASNAVLFTARSRSKSSYFLLNCRSFSAGRPLHVCSYLSGDLSSYAFRKIALRVSDSLCSTP